MDKDVEPSKSIPNLRRQALNACCVPEVKRDEGCASPGMANPVVNLLEGARGSRHGCHVNAVRRQRACDLGAEAAGSAGYKRKRDRTFFAGHVALRRVAVSARCPGEVSVSARCLPERPDSRP